MEFEWADDPFVSLNVSNVVSADGCGPGSDQLASHNDWASLRYGFTFSSDFGYLERRETIPPDAEIPIDDLIAASERTDFDRDGIANAADVRIAAYDALDSEGSILVDRRRSAGRHEVIFDAAELPSGIYLYRMTAGSEVRTGRMVLLK